MPLEVVNKVPLKRYTTPRLLFRVPCAVSGHAMMCRGNMLVTAPKMLFDFIRDSRHSNGLIVRFRVFVSAVVQSVDLCFLLFTPT